jgi:hypothetical protein
MDGLAGLPFREIWAVDFEFIAQPGDRPEPICVIARELRKGRRIKLWRDQFGATPPYGVDANALFVAYFASAELGCHRTLGWPMPARILDLYAEFRNRTNGLQMQTGNSLVGALIYFGLDHIEATKKAAIRHLVLAGGPWSDQERADVLDYCESDVAALARLLPAMLPRIDLRRALLRGRYMAAVAAMEHYGVPIDVAGLERLKCHWAGIQAGLIADIDADYHVYDGRTFKLARFEEFLIKTSISWPRLESGHLELSDNAFKQAAKAYPVISPLRELRHALSELRLNDLAAGRDGRHRALLSPFSSRTGRNQPSSKRFIFGPSVWIRGLIKPPPGHGLSYIDWSQQEFGIAAALSRDAAMQTAYLSGDAYLAFAQQAGAVPTDATKASHGPKRELFKICALAVQYGMGAESLALRIGQPTIVARDLLSAHRQSYPTFWRWSDGAVDYAMLRGFLPTVFNWRVHVGADSNPRSLRNFPMQANGAEMLRLACCLATERGVEVCAPVHDAVLICAPLEGLSADVDRMQAAMAEASRIVLNGFELRTDAKVIKYPDRYMDPRGATMWGKVFRLVAKIEQAGEAKRLIAS